uniref:Immunoglobulin superfamily containing leucine-rich repeat 2 n=1 Tax=Salarias fasciatus TaxID=181472 RepID=A0A672GX96_SALFA
MFPLTVVIVLGCPEVCVCSNKFGRYSAECANKLIVEIPDGFPPNVTTLSLTANKIRLIPPGSFDNVTRVTSLWLGHNEILSIEQGALAPLIHLRNLDISHNKIIDFPWDDLQNLTALHLLKMNNNEMVNLPRDAFANLKDLRSLRINNNRFTTIAKGEDCEVQVLFITKRRVPNLLIIVSVSICLLTVSTVPLLGATCFHLVYKYRSKTYKLILKAKDQYHMERTLAANFNVHAPHTESQRKINGSQLDEEDEGEEEGESESVDGEKEADTEESLVTESFSLSQCRGNVDDCEMGSEYSDRLPLGAEAINITSNFKYPNQ